MKGTESANPEIKVDIDRILRNLSELIFFLVNYDICRNFGSKCSDYNRPSGLDQLQWIDTYPMDQSNRILIQHFIKAESFQNTWNQNNALFQIIPVEVPKAGFASWGKKAEGDKNRDGGSILP